MSGEKDASFGGVDGESAAILGAVIFAPVIATVTAGALCAAGLYSIGSMTYGAASAAIKATKLTHRDHEREREIVAESKARAARYAAECKTRDKKHLEEHINIILKTISEDPDPKMPTDPSPTSGPDAPQSMRELITSAKAEKQYELANLLLSLWCARVSLRKNRQSLLALEDELPDNECKKLFAKAIKELDLLEEKTDALTADTLGDTAAFAKQLVGTVGDALHRILDRVNTERLKKGISPKRICVVEALPDPLLFAYRDRTDELFSFEGETEEEKLILAEEEATLRMEEAVSMICTLSALPWYKSYGSGLQEIFNSLEKTVYSDSLSSADKVRIVSEHHEKLLALEKEVIETHQAEIKKKLVFDRLLEENNLYRDELGEKPHAIVFEFARADEQIQLLEAENAKRKPLYYAKLLGEQLYKNLRRLGYYPVAGADKTETTAKGNVIQHRYLITPNEGAVLQMHIVNGETVRTTLCPLSDAERALAAEKAYGEHFKVATEDVEKKTKLHFDVKQTDFTKAQYEAGKTHRASQELLSKAKRAIASKHRASRTGATATDAKHLQQSNA